MNDYILKAQSAQHAGVGYASMSQQNANSCATIAPKQTAIEDAIVQVGLMHEQLNIISLDVASFLERAAGGSLNDPPKAACDVPIASGGLPRLGQNLRVLKELINMLGERVLKLNQIA